MTIIQSIVLGAVQGLTEVLPISSSAHLVLVPWICGWEYQGLSFDVALHLGTALAFCVYFFNDWVELIRGALIRDHAGKKNRFFWYIVLGTVPAGLAGLVFEKKAETVFRSPGLIAAMLFVFAIILWLADHLGKKQKPIDQMDLKTAVVVGLAQAVAIVPGVSRSGITISAGLCRGFSREAAARFSFLLATPIVVAAGALKMTELHAADLNPVFWAGVISSALSGLVGIRLLLGLVRRFSLDVFVAYRVALALLIFLIAWCAG